MMVFLRMWANGKCKRKLERKLMNNHFLSMLQEDTTVAAAISFFLMVVIAFIPAMPIPVIAGAIATTFGFWPALFISWGGSTIGALLMFCLSRFLFHKKVVRLSQGHQRLTGMLHLLEKNGFLAILIARIIPIFPSIVINLAASVSTISPRTFFMATLLGKLPTMITFTWAGNQVEESMWSTLVLVGLYSAILILVAKKVREKMKPA